MTENQNNPEWLEISIDVDPIAHEALISFLIDLGCEGIVTEDFDDQTLKAYYPVNETPDSLRDRISLFMQDLADIFPEIKSNKVDIKQVEKQDWATSWRSFFSIDRVTDNLTIVPAWEQAPNPDEGRIILIDPGPAFGTGKHPTTRMCLMALEKASVRSNSGMLDVGTGSGILAVYGAMLGAISVAAIDNDPEAVRWAKKNIELNPLPVQIDLSTTPLSEITGTYSIITANIILNTIVELSGFFPALLAPEGDLIVSGLLRDQVSQVEDIFTQQGLIRRDLMTMEEWACLVMSKQVA